MKDLHVTIQIALEKSAQWNKSSENGVAAGALQVGDLKLDLRRRSATRGRKSIPLTAREYVLGTSKNPSRAQVSLWDR